MTDRLISAADRLADAAGELLFEMDKRGTFSRDTLDALAVAKRQYRHVRRTDND